MTFYNRFAPDLYAAGFTSKRLPGLPGGHFVTVDKRGNLGTFHSTPIGRPIDLGVGSLGFSVLGSLSGRGGDEGGIKDTGGLSVTFTVPGKFFILGSIASGATSVSNFSNALTTLARDPNNQGAREFVKGVHTVPVTVALAFNADALATKAALVLTPKVAAGLALAMRATKTNTWVGGAYNAATMKFVDGKPTSITIRGREFDIAEIMRQVNQAPGNRTEQGRFGISH